MTRRMKAKGRMHAQNSWWVSELLAVDCKKRGFTQIGRTPSSNGTRGSMRRRRRRKKEEHQKLVSRLIASAAGEADFLHRIAKPAASNGGLRVLEEFQEIAEKEWAKH